MKIDLTGKVALVTASTGGIVCHRPRAGGERCGSDRERAQRRLGEQRHSGATAGGAGRTGPCRHSRSKLAGGR